MAKNLTNEELEEAIETVANFSFAFRGLSGSIGKGKVEDLENIHAKIGALMGVISACAELSGALATRAIIQEQQAELAALHAAAKGRA